MSSSVTDTLSEELIQSKRFGEIWIVPKVTGQKRHEIEREDYDKILLALRVFGASKVGELRFIAK